MAKRLFAITVILLAALADWAQCPDFTDLTAPGVTCRYGLFEAPMMYTGIVAGRHSVITQQGMDPYTGYQLPLLPPGENAVVKLGNDLGGKQGECIDYDFVVDPDNPILTIKYAFVLKNGNLSSTSPTFSIFFLNPQNTGTSYSPYIYPCGSSSFAIPHIQSYVTFQTTGTVLWKPWSNIIIDLSQYAGQLVRVRFLTYDGQTDPEAFGYTYFTASCSSNHLTVLGCDGDQITLAAPDGYSGYSWNNGATTQTATYSTAEGLDVACTLQPEQGCTSILKNAHIQGLTITHGDAYYDTICQGEAYHAHGFDIPPQNEAGEYDFARLVFNNGDCFSGVETTLNLTVLQRYFHYYDVVCEGTDYDNYGFHYTNLPPGTILDSIPIALSNGCDSGYRYLHLTVNEVLSVSGELYGETNVCDKNLQTYSLLFPGSLNYYTWSLPDGIVSLTGGGLPYVSLYFTEESPNPAEISVTAGNACGNHTFTLSVWHTPAYYLVYEDTLCTGSEYTDHDFQTARLDSAGLYFLSHNSTTANGCDSNVTVRLVVFPSPTVTTLAQPEEICSGESSIVLAVGEHGAIVPYTPQQVVPGDILCTDSTIVKPAEWPMPGKTAKAIVFFVDSTGQHGWAVHLQDQGSFPWCTNGCSAIMGLLSSPLGPQYEFNGKYNTQTLRGLGDATEFPAAWAVDVDNGWYLPAIGQLILIFYELHVVNESLSLVNGSPFVPFTPSPTFDPYEMDNFHANCYWSATTTAYLYPDGSYVVTSSPYFFDISSYALISGIPGGARKVRSVIDF